MLNEVTLIGYFGNDPQLDQNLEQKGHKKATFSLSLYRYGQKNGNFIYCEGWNKTAEIIMTHGKKRCQALVKGELRVDVWGEGEQRKSRTYINVNRIVVLQQPSNNGGGNQNQTNASQNTGANNTYNASQTNTKKEEPVKSSVGQESNFTQNDDPFAGTDPFGDDSLEMNLNELDDLMDEFK